MSTSIGPASSRCRRPGSGARRPMSRSSATSSMARPITRRASQAALLRLHAQQEPLRHPRRRRRRSGGLDRGLRRYVDDRYRLTASRDSRCCSARVGAQPASGRPAGPASPSPTATTPGSSPASARQPIRRRRPTTRRRSSASSARCGVARTGRTATTCARHTSLMPKQLRGFFTHGTTRRCGWLGRVAGSRSSRCRSRGRSRPHGVAFADRDPGARPRPRARRRHPRPSRRRRPRGSS